MSSVRIRWSTQVAAGVAVALVALFMFIVAAGCGSGGDSTGGSGGAITLTDDAGQAVTLSKPAERVISISPADTEIAYAIGAGAKMVGGNDYDDYPAEAKSLPSVGDFSNPSVEKIVALQPDLVLAAGGVQASLRSRLEDLGIKVYVVDPTTYAGTMADLQNLGKLLGTSEQAEQVVADMRAALEDVRAKVASLAKRTVFFEIYGEPLMTAGRGTFINDLIKLAGGTNIGAGAGTGYPEFSAEVLVRDNPEVYVAVEGSQSAPGDIAGRTGYSQLQAVKNNRVFVIADNLVVRPGPRLAQGLRQLAEMIHPEAFAAQ